MSGDVPPERAGMVIVGSCQGWHVIDATQLADYYLPFGVASVLGSLLALAFWLFAEA